MDKRALCVLALVAFGVCTLAAAGPSANSPPQAQAVWASEILVPAQASRMAPAQTTRTPPAQTRTPPAPVTKQACNKPPETDLISRFLRAFREPAWAA
jgi:hypothetical protein